MSEPEVMTPDEVAAIEQGFAGLVPLDGKGLDHENAWMLVPEFRTTKSGVSVNTRTALEISAVMSCCVVIAEDVGKMPFQLYRWDTKDKSGRTHRMRSFPEPLHPLAKLMGKPNPDMTGQAFRETLTLFALLTGTGYAWKARDGKGMVRELWPLVPGSCVPRRDNGNWHDLYYDVWFEDGTHTRAEPSDIFRITGISWDGVCGLNRVTLAREVFGLSKRINEAQAKFYGKDQRPSGVISSATPLKPDLVDRVRTTWAKQFGPDGEGGVAVLDGGWTFEAMNVSAKDAELDRVVAAAGRGGVPRVPGAAPEGDARHRYAELRQRRHPQPSAPHRHARPVAGALGAGGRARPARRGRSGTLLEVQPQRLPAAAAEGPLGHLHQGPADQRHHGERDPRLRGLAAAR